MIRNSSVRCIVVSKIIFTWFAHNRHTTYNFPDNIKNRLFFLYLCEKSASKKKRKGWHLKNIFCVYKCVLRDQKVYYYSFMVFTTSNILNLIHHSSSHLCNSIFWHILNFVAILYEFSKQTINDIFFWTLQGY